MKIIPHFLIPKYKVIHVYDDFTIEQALDTIKSTRFSAIPILNRKGNYIGTLSEGDLLWYISSLNYTGFEKINLMEVPRLRDNEPLDINANNEILIAKASNENFVPILDENNIFLGIVTRKEIIDYFFEHKFIVL